LGKGFIFISCMVVLLLFPSQVFAITVVVDPGHGGHDPGAIGVNGLKEKNINLDISNKLVQELNKMGYETIMTRESDQYMTLQERVTFANNSGGDLFVSIHSNSHPNKGAQGTLVLYYDDTYQQADYPASSAMRLLSAENKALARSIQDHVIQEVNTVDRGIVPSGVFVVRNGIMPSVLIEAAFLSNKEDAALLAKESFRAAIASGIAQGINKYQPSVFYDLNNHWAKEPILQLEELGIVNGDNGAFYPNRQMTRAEFITILDRLFSFEKLLNNTNIEDAVDNEEAVQIQPDVGVIDPVEPIKTEEIKQFPDLTGDHWAYATINMATQLGIVSGFEDGTIRPNYPISRAEMVVLFDKLALSETPISITNQFVDVPEQSWYASSVYKMKELGYIHGTTDTSFAPNRQMSRAEGASIISRYLRSDSGMIVLNNLKLGAVK
jgi:N-acetylmuramoyl-L-alanine amidase